MQSNSYKNQLIIKNVKTIDGHLIEHAIPSEINQSLDAKGKLTLFPALIDPHVHFNTLTWSEEAKSALEGGITTVLARPDSKCRTKDYLETTMRQIDEKLAAIQVPLRYRLYLNADNDSLDEIGKAKNIAGISPYINGSVEHFKEILERIFQRAALENVIVAPHVENSDIKTFRLFLELAEKYNNELVLSVSSEKEIDLVRQAKKRGFLVYAEGSLHKETDQDALWKGIQEETIDFVSSGHASTNSLKSMLPALLTAFQEKNISLDKIVHLTRINTERIFRLASQTDIVLVDLETTKPTPDKKSFFSEKVLKGWPVYTILKGQIFSV